MSEDFPTFDLPKNANSGCRGGGHCCRVEAEVMNWAEVMRMALLLFTKIILYIIFIYSCFIQN